MQCLHWMASRFGVKQLMEDVGRVFIEILLEDTLFQTPVSFDQCAEESRDLVLKENSVQYLAWNFQNLTRSPAWTKLPMKLLRILLTRIDLVVPDEYFLLQALESWIMDRGNSTNLETQVDLLSHIRFPMIPAKKLYDLENHSSLHGTHVGMFWDKVFKALQFNVLLFSKLQSSPKFNKDDNDFKPRIYTAEPWGVAIDPSKRVPGPVHQRRFRYHHAYHPTTQSLEGQAIKVLYSTMGGKSLQEQPGLFKPRSDLWVTPNSKARSWKPVPQRQCHLSQPTPADVPMQVRQSGPWLWGRHHSYYCKRDPRCCLSLSCWPVHLPLCSEAGVCLIIQQTLRMLLLSGGFPLMDLC